ncbi:MAG: decarboxylating 6-phosphogluconate dehydrogenase [Candidatus Doudnabacteria bacterium]|nr:decarboxylating 6-phosphogluconate dehydrogenase [Candidatus Doudnabacteria bacterium]
MEQKVMQIGIFGLGRMGLQIAKRLHNNGFEVLAWNRSVEPRNEFKKFGGKTYEKESDLIKALNVNPKIIWIMLPHAIVDEFLKNILHQLIPGDIIIDGGNSFYKDSIRRAEELKKFGITFYDIGTSGGVWGLERGFALMAGGPSEHWHLVEPFVKVLSSGENFGLVGGSGAGHFVKMVHNGIEYGMMEAIGEGYAVMKASNFKLDLAQVSKIYQKGSVISSWLIDLTRTIFEKEDLDSTSGFIDSTGEGEWTIKTAEELGVDARVIKDSFQVRLESKESKNQNKFSNKIVSLLRKQFGGHSIKSNDEN